MFRASATGFNGQGMWMSALTQQESLAGYKPMVGDGVNAFSSATSNVNHGIELTVLPLVSPGAQDITLDVQMAWIPSAEVVQRPVRLASGQAEATIDQSRRAMRTVSGMSKLRIGDALAMSIPAQVDNKAASLEWEDWLIVSVRKPGH